MPASRARSRSTCRRRVGSAGLCGMLGRMTGDVPTTVGAYHLFEAIGRGGMGVVYRARHLSESMADRQGGDVAIKVILSHYADDPVFRARFEREAGVGLSFEHPGIVRVMDLVMDGSTLAIVMELVHGQPLSTVIGERVGPIPWPRALRLFSELLDAVGYAHDRSVVHRDLKPDNVMLLPDDRIKIFDFGIAKDLSAVGTATGLGIGTVGYMAPEQYQEAGQVDVRADIYALGMTLYEMLAGRLPWSASTTDFEVLSRKAQGQLPSPTEYYPHIPTPIVEAVFGALESDVDDRFPSVISFRKSLDSAAEASRAGKVPRPPPPSKPLLRGRVILISIAVLGLWVGLVALAWSYLTEEPTEGAPLASAPGPAEPTAPQGEPTAAVSPPPAPETQEEKPVRTPSKSPERNKADPLPKPRLSNQTSTSNAFVGEHVLLTATGRNLTADCRVSVQYNVSSSKSASRPVQRGPHGRLTPVSVQVIGEMGLELRYSFFAVCPAGTARTRTAAIQIL
ncbi:MAG: protein kinase [Proteobacteria bacterium]|nr:protein kinase [Pseudomonadota bacterium]